MNIENANPIEVGKRMFSARRARNLSQEDTALHIGVSRPTYVAKEQGKRQFSSSEIVALAALLGRSVNELVSARVQVNEFAPQFRVSQLGQVSQRSVDEAVDQFRRVCGDYLWLEQMLGAPLPRNREIEQYDINGYSPQTAAEDIAALERSRLNLGQGPVLNILDALEAEAGLRFFVLPIEEFRIAGMFVYTDDLGGCVLINGKHPVTRRSWSAAHEFAHFLTARYATEVTVLTEYERKPRAEQFADYFAASFLMPAAGLRQRFNSIVKSRKDFTVSDLCNLADYYGVSLEAMTRRLERLGCVKAGTWSRLSDAGLPGRRPATTSSSGDLRTPSNIRLPDRYMRLAAQAFEEVRITEGQLAQLLHVSRVEAREVVNALTQSAEVDLAGGMTYQLDLDVGATLDLASTERD